MWHLIEENTMTVGVPFSRQFRKIITSDLYGIGENSDRRLTRQEIATMQTGTVVSFHERGSELRRGTFLVSSVSVLRFISPGQLIGELLSNQELTHFCHVKNLSTKTYATSVIQAYEFVKKMGDEKRNAVGSRPVGRPPKQQISVNKRPLPKEVATPNTDKDNAGLLGNIAGILINEAKKQKSVESFTRDFPSGSPNKSENKEEIKDESDGFHVSNNVQMVDDSDDDMGDVKVEFIEDEDEDIEEIDVQPEVTEKPVVNQNNIIQIQRLLEIQQLNQQLIQANSKSHVPRRDQGWTNTGLSINSGVRKYNAPGTIRDISFNQGNPSKYGRITVMGLVFRIEVEGKVYNYKLKTLSYCKAGIVAYLGCVNQSRGKRPLSSESACCKATARLVLDSSLPELVEAHQRKSLSYSEPILRKISTYKAAECSYQPHISEACEWNGISYTAHPENFSQANLTPVHIAPAQKIIINKL